MPQPASIEEIADAIHAELPKREFQVDAQKELYIIGLVN